LKQLSINGSAVVVAILGIAAPPDASVPPPTATPECEEAVDAIFEGWQDIIDGWADVPLEEFVAEERIYNVTDVPIGGAGCEPLTATTIATDRAGELKAETATGAVVRGLILSDVGEMAIYGPGLDLDVPMTPAVPDVTADLDSLVDLEPSAGSSCGDWQVFAVTVLPSRSTWLRWPISERCSAATRTTTTVSSCSTRR
jgi:hypothetical protein